MEENVYYSSTDLKVSHEPGAAEISFGTRFRLSSPVSLIVAPREVLWKKNVSMMLTLKMISTALKSPNVHMSTL